MHTSAAPIRDRGFLNPNFERNKSCEAKDQFEDRAAVAKLQVSIAEAISITVSAIKGLAQGGKDQRQRLRGWVGSRSHDCELMARRLSLF